MVQLRVRSGEKMNRGSLELIYLTIGITILLVIGILLVDNSSIFESKIESDVEQRKVLY